MMCKRIIIGLATVIVIFLAAAFAQWDLNPGNWDIRVRTSAAFLALFLGPWAGASPFIKDRP